MTMIVIRKYWNWIESCSFPVTVRYVLDNKKYKGYVEYYFRWDGETCVRKQVQHTEIVTE